MEYDEDTESIEKTTYPHPEGEIWQIKCSTLDSTLLTTSHSKGKKLRIVTHFSNVATAAFQIGKSVSVA